MKHDKQEGSTEARRKRKGVEEQQRPGRMQNHPQDRTRLQSAEMRMTEITVEEVVESMKQIFEGGDLDGYLESVSKSIHAYFEDIKSIKKEEDQMELAKHLDWIYESAAIHYIELSKWATKYMEDKSSFPMFFTVAYFLCYIQSEMAKIPEWQAHVIKSMIEGGEHILQTKREDDIAYR